MIHCYPLWPLTSSMGLAPVSFLPFFHSFVELSVKEKAKEIVKSSFDLHFGKII
jgi:hypothetical protein